MLMLRRAMFVLVSSALFLSSSVIMFPATTSALIASGCNSSFLGLPAWYKYLDVGPDEATGDPCAITGPSVEDVPSTIDVDESAGGALDWQKAIPRIAIALTEILLRLATLVALGFVLYGGFRFITSQGEPENAKSARQTILNAVIGLVIALLAAAIVSFLGTELSKSVTAATPNGFAVSVNFTQGLL